MSNTVVENGSLMDKLKAQRDQLTANKTVDIEIPGWSGMLYGRYTTLPWEIVRAGAKENETAADELSRAWRTLGAACECVLIDNGNGPEPYGEPPVKFDKRLAELTGDTTSRTQDQIIDALFPSELAVMVHCGKYVEWLSGSDASVADALGKHLNGTGE